VTFGLGSAALLYALVSYEVDKRFILLRFMHARKYILLDLSLAHADPDDLLPPAAPGGVCDELVAKHLWRRLRPDDHRRELPLLQRCRGTRHPHSKPLAEQIADRPGMGGGLFHGSERLDPEGYKIARRGVSASRWLTRRVSIQARLCASEDRYHDGAARLGR
jgi:hypothetical protein